MSDVRAVITGRWQFLCSAVSVALYNRLNGIPLRRGGRVVEGGRLESGCTVTGTVSSNLILSAIQFPMDRISRGRVA